MNYYFLVAGFPAFAPGDAPPLSLDEFLDRCRRELSTADYTSLEHLLGQEPGGPAASGFPQAWQQRDTQIRNAVVRLRAAAGGADAGPYLKESLPDGFLQEAVEDAYARPDPLEREMELDRLRWRVLDELGLGHYFDLTAVMIYALKLKLALRWRVWNEAKGRECMDGLMAEADKSITLSTEAT